MTEPNDPSRPNGPQDPPGGWVPPGGAPQDYSSWSNPETPPQQGWQQHQQPGWQQQPYPAAPQQNWQAQQPAWQAGYGKPGVIPLRPLAVGEMLDGAITTIRRYPGVVLGTSAAVALLSGIANAVASLALDDQLARLLNAEPGELTDDDLASLLTTTFTATGISLVVTVLATLFLTGFLMIVVGRAVLGQPIDFGTTMRELKPRLLPLVGLSLLVTVIVILGTVACIAPGIWLYVGLALAVPVLILENTTIRGAMSRSWRLVQGSWWRTCGILLVAMILALLINAVITVPFSLLGGGTAAFSTEYTELTFTRLLAETTGSVLATTLTAPFTAIVSALLYVDQRMRREGMDIALARAAGLAPNG